MKREDETAKRLEELYSRLSRKAEEFMDKLDEVCRDPEAHERGKEFERRLGKISPEELLRKFTI